MFDKYHSEYLYIYIISFLLILLLIYVLYKFFTNIDNKNDPKSIKKYVDNLKKEHLKFPTEFGSGRDYVITKYHNLLTSKQCDLLINIAKKKGLHNSEVYGNGGTDIKGSTVNNRERISQQVWLTKTDDEIINRMKLISEYITKIPVDNQEEVQVVKYEKGGYFKIHHDACSGNIGACFGMNGKSGQRITTLLCYLNDNYKGGETKFVDENVNLTIKPVKGMAILFYNVSEIDFHTIHPLSKHSGTEIEEGLKWISNIWSHEMKYSSDYDITDAEKKNMEIVNAPSEPCTCPNCPNPNCPAKKEKVLKCRMKKCPNEKCPNYYMKHLSCKCPFCPNPYCKSKEKKNCEDPYCKNKNCPVAKEKYKIFKKNIISAMVK